MFLFTEALARLHDIEGTSHTVWLAGLSRCMIIKAFHQDAETPPQILPLLCMIGSCVTRDCSHCSVVKGS